ncbi:hypothetical protein Cgig2_009675 [Carnegiea gigantea]|uniref:Uncharacterized protein n=1 Tax=Carnegiea gigantea TaxID=171969 RepID=A0A9Q1JME7_9CARY|nr:hypothetical protein Cgig2_009675 [Carnegiea gigantea]
MNDTSRNKTGGTILSPMTAVGIGKNCVKSRNYSSRDVLFQGNGTGKARIHIRSAIWQDAQNWWPTPLPQQDLTGITTALLKLRVSKASKSITYAIFTSQEIKSFFAIKFNPINEHSKPLRSKIFTHHDEPKFIPITSLCHSHLRSATWGVKEHDDIEGMIHDTCGFYVSMPSSDPRDRHGDVHDNGVHDGDVHNVGENNKDGKLVKALNTLEPNAYVTVDRHTIVGDSVDTIPRRDASSVQVTINRTSTDNQRSSQSDRMPSSNGSGGQLGNFEDDEDDDEDLHNRDQHS